MLFKLFPKYILVLCVSALLVSCISNKKDIIPSHTVIVYMAAENNLYSYAQSNINHMEAGYTKGNLLVFYDNSDKTEILKISQDSNSEIVSEVVWSYDGEFNSVDPENMNMILSWIIDRYPADSYGLILWSHGCSWLPGTPQPKTKWFGQDLGNGDIRMDIQDFYRAIPGNTFDYIAIDACFMGAVEVAWELRSKTDYLIAAPTEILANGFPYRDIVPVFFDANPIREKTIRIAQLYYDYYTSSSGTISVYYLPEIEELATKTKQLITSNAFTVWDYNANNVQVMDRPHVNGIGQNVMYDFVDFFEKNFPQSAVEPLKTQLDKMIIYKASTPNFLEITINTYCGISAYLPKPALTTTNNYYKTLSWTYVSGYDKLLGL